MIFQNGPTAVYELELHLLGRNRLSQPLQTALEAFLRSTRSHCFNTLGNQLGIGRTVLRGAGSFHEE